MAADEDDKYPDSSGRRRFVKGVVGSAALASVGATTSAAINTTTARSGAGGGTLQYFGIENTDGPAPRAMPMIPVRIDDEGFLKGYWPEVSTEMIGGRQVTVAREQLGSITYSSEWFQYCGVQTYQGVEPDADQDNYFRYVQNPPSAYGWQQDVEAGGKIHIDDFADYETWNNGIGNAGAGKPAMATWRSQGTENVIPVQVLRSTHVEQAKQQAEGEIAAWLNAATRNGFMAWLDKCTHFCCVPAFKAYKDSAKFGAANEVYCQCHQSVYDPYSIVKKTFVALPRPSDE
ncbi:MAG: ubiquinol-cytochrome c reductase iron-sulfur subunit [Halobacteriales archaeon]